ncbi:ribulose bisphosphate carboxylase small subunit [Oscillatoria sp. CS-180]|uniref:ribulose bisphosphate carboxylase small subunit n=1 Tax=Oscillatoria sp. CS-180 TaxID=3021720 RepID=UPI00232BC978|nr:ribulose bisphosphate carboxylase small subunit [Oscillatoria sp. CS-180]MDB9528555.1 ribulose bisphosphate carboxylase small subunit [Oscillatoria sp. CS-180]
MAYYISPRFLDKLAVHITKNYLNLDGVRVPLILGIHGRKGEGKTFHCELVYERMGIEVVNISGGELESPDAGDPARLIRLRYREAAELVRVRGVMAVLMINDLDAGAGRFDAMTQYTVNTQLVNNTLMNIADNPTNVQLPGSYDDKPIQRVPIIVTGNDFATLYEPLVRDGRMEKFYWQPDRSDRIGIVGGIFAPDNLGQGAIEQLVDTFPQQAIDFYGALRARIYDEQVRDFIHSVGISSVSSKVVNSDKPLQFAKPTFTLSHLLDVGQQMVSEQRYLQEMRLADQYNRALRERSLPTHSQPASPPTQPFYRAYDAPTSNGNSQSSQSSESQPVSFRVNPQSSSKLSTETVNHVQSLLNQGYRVGLEHVDQRRFRTNAWKSCSTVHAQDSNEAIATLEQCLVHYPDEYVRLIGIDPKNKQRVLEHIIQRPHQT